MWVYPGPHDPVLCKCPARRPRRAATPCQQLAWRSLSVWAWPSRANRQRLKLHPIMPCTRGPPPQPPATFHASLTARSETSLVTVHAEPSPRAVMLTLALARMHRPRIARRMTHWVEPTNGTEKQCRKRRDSFALSADWASTERERESGRRDGARTARRTGTGVPLGAFEEHSVLRPAALASVSASSASRRHAGRCAKHAGGKALRPLRSIRFRLVCRDSEATMDH